MGHFKTDGSRPVLVITETASTVATCTRRWRDVNKRRDEKLLKENYIASDDAPTVADYSAYCEYDQLEPMGLLDNIGEKYPKVAAWIERMKQVPHHDEIRVTMNGFLKATGLAGAAKKTEA